MKQLDIFDLFNMQEETVAQAPQIITVQEQGGEVKEVLSGLPHIAPLDATAQPDLEVEWVSLALAKLTTKDKAKSYYALVLPMAPQITDAIEHIRECFTAAGIDPYVPWDEQGISMLKPGKAFSKNEMARHCFGMAGDINGGYAIKPICPECGKEVTIQNVLIGGQPFEPVCGVETDCGHKSIAVMVFLPGYQYAQQVFETFSFRKEER